MLGVYRLQIVTQDGIRYDGPVESVRAPGVLGSFGVRAGHAPMVAELGVGLLLVREATGAERAFACSGGILEVSRAGVVVLGDAVEEQCDINVERARASEQRARTRLQDARTAEVDIERAEVALARALNRLKVARRGR